MHDKNPISIDQVKWKIWFGKKAFCPSVSFLLVITGKSLTDFVIKPFPVIDEVVTLSPDSQQTSNCTNLIC